MQVVEQVISIIYEAIDEVNEARPKRDWVRKEHAEELAGLASRLDSLSLLNLVMGVEERVNAKFYVSLDLSTTLALDPSASPLRTVATFADYVGSQLKSAG